MFDWDDFRRKVEAVSLTLEEQVGDKKSMVGVLIADRDPDQENFVKDDFNWMKAPGKVTIAKVQSAYIRRQPGADVELWFEGALLSPDTPIRDLATPDKPVVALLATLKGVRPASLAFRPPSINTPIQPPSPAIDVVNQHPPSALPTPMSADKDAPADSIETSARPLHFTRVTSAPLSDAPNSLVPGNTPDFWIPPPTAARHQPSVHVSAYAAQAEAGEQATETNDLEANAGPGLQSILSPQIMPRKEHSSQAGSLAPEDPPLSQNFNVDDVFDRDASPELDSGERTKLLNHHIREVVKQETVELLEAGVARSMKILDTLQETFSEVADVSPDAQQWIDTIKKMKEQPDRSRTIIGVVGNTGAGKSSVINALLDEERLVPTNCMRACTAVVTEISWNSDNDPDHRYRAEIEFINRADWEKDLKVLMQEFLSESGTLTREASDPNTDAGIAWAKFHAVYPSIQKEKLASYTVETLMTKTAVLNVLGTTKEIYHPRAKPFYAELQELVDSKEKVTGKKDHQKQQKNQMEFWPLIKVVRLYTKSEALSTGAVVVDLPGVHDSNAARAAVAERYIQQCSGLWIVAPITRAVDDKAAKNLMGSAFRRQLKYDGNYSAVTFICSKTDDISATEAVDSLDLDQVYYELEEQVCESEEKISRMRDESANLQKTTDKQRTILGALEDEIEIWEELQKKIKTQTVYAPRSKKNRKRRQIDDEDSEIESEIDDSSDSEHESGTDDNVAAQVPLTMQDIEQKIASLKQAKKDPLKEVKKMQARIKALKPQLRELSSKIANANARKLAICIQGRNEYSKTAIQKDFAAGIKELDQEAAMEADEEAFDPDKEIRDYDEVADSLPVFCVSSRAYQKMCGRLKKDEAVPGFQTQEETQIPQLKSHCMKLTQGGRIRDCRAFLTSFCSTLTALFLWASDDGTGPQMTDAKKQEQAHYLAKRLADLRKGLGKAVEVCLGSMTKQLQEQIFVRMEVLMRRAISSAPTIAQSWGHPKELGGLHYNTYKAIVRRGGVYQSATVGLRNMNEELLDPLIRQLATRWESAFQQRLPQAFEAYTKNSGDVLHAFHARIEERARLNGFGLAHMAMLKGSIFNYEQMFRTLNDQLKIRLTEAQRDANREFVPTLANFMMTVYDQCAIESGAGAFMRMKNYMETFIQTHSQTMFQAATQNVEGALRNMCRDLEAEMSKKADEISNLIHRDYMHALAGVQATLEIENQPKRSMKAEVMAQLNQIHSQFERLAQGDLTEGPDSSEHADDDAVAGADTAAEQPIQAENSATNSPMDHAPANDEIPNSLPDDSQPIVTSPGALRPRKKRRITESTASSPAPSTRNRSKKPRLPADTTPAPTPSARKSSRIADASSARKASQKSHLADGDGDEEL
ncbi:hypothetical protein DPSP01_001963 [Paraphaeosphaeria sporulosa]